MASPSAFQSLPLHIAENIVQCYIGSHRLSYASDKDKEAHKKTAWEVLYHVSGFWRRLATNFFCRKITFTIAADIGASKFSFANWPCSIRMCRSNNYYILVKEIAIDIQSVFERIGDSDLLKLNEVWPSSLTFPMASIVHVDVEGGRSFSQINAFNADNQKVCWAAQRVQESVPRVREIILSTSILSSRLLRTSCKLLAKLKTENLLSTTLSDFIKVDLNDTSIFQAGDYLHLLKRPCITTLVYNCRQSIEAFQQIIKLNTSILTSLTIHGYYYSSISYLVQDSDGNLIVYPQLERLEFHGDSTKNAWDAFTTDKNVALFPALKSLEWPSFHAFRDDTLFRGNSNTLEHLNLRIDSYFVKVMQDYNVFANYKYQKLRSIVSLNGSNPNCEQLDDDTFLRFNLGFLSPATRALSVETFEKSLPVIDIMSAYPYLDNLRILDIRHTTFELLDICDLIKLLPNLTDLGCKHGEISADSKGNEHSTLLERLSLIYYPLSQRLKCWVVPATFNFEIKSVAITAIILTILCPSFTFAAVWSPSLNSYHRKLSSLIASEPYSKYSDRLQCLFNKV
ncbi:hypothetical protein BX070DRAFT_236296 [Coemansia spiralis]|nr:hypothetical protein BX070DRAFT_236296 [Coemansia spiralis]